MFNKNDKYLCFTYCIHKTDKSKQVFKCRPDNPVCSTIITKAVIRENPTTLFTQKFPVANDFKTSGTLI